jgi:hypothetical protein
MSALFVTEKSRKMKREYRCGKHLTPRVSSSKGNHYQKGGDSKLHTAR